MAIIYFDFYSKQINYIFKFSFIKWVYVNK